LVHQWLKRSAARLTLFVQFIAGEQLARSAAAVAEIFGKVLQACRDVVGVIIELLVIDEFAGGTFAACDLVKASCSASLMVAFRLL
jgi:hypothetical protein